MSRIRPRTLYTAFAVRAQRVIAHPAHFSLFLIVLAFWAAWSAGRHWDTFSALVGNDVTTYAEYAFAILTLAAALSAADKADAIMDHLSRQQDRLERIEQHALTLIEQMAAREGIEDRDGSGADPA